MDYTNSPGVWQNSQNDFSSGFTVITSNDSFLEVYPIGSKRDLGRYTNFLNAFRSNPFYKLEMLQFGLGAQEALYYFIYKHKEEVLALMPFTIREVVIGNVKTGYLDVSSPYGYSGPLFAKGLDRDHIELFWKQVDQWYKQNKVVSEFIRFNMKGNYKGYNGRLQASLKNVCGHIIGEEEQWRNFKPKVRNNFRKSQKSNLTSTISYKNISQDEIKNFHAIYSKAMERKQAAPMYIHSLDYFQRLVSNNPVACAIAIVYKDERAISAELLLISDSSIYSFLGGTDSDYFEVRPNDFLKIQVLAWARKRGYKRYYLGGGREDVDSLYRYKKYFFPSDDDIVFYTGRKILDKEVYKELVMTYNPMCVGCIVSSFFPLYRCERDCN